MSRLKHTKTELRSQREALERYLRFLPMLQLKKEQLQLEIHHVDAQIADRTRQLHAAGDELNRWVALLSEPVDLGSILSVESVQVEEGNIAGVAIPWPKAVNFRRVVPDLFASPPWVDDAVEMLERLAQLSLEIRLLEEARRRIEAELRVTSQRLNLFEKVKIPECRRNIQIIKIFLGDQQTAAVARAKLAKRILQSYAAETAGVGHES